MRARRILCCASALTLLLLAAGISGQAPNQGSPLTVLSRDGRKPLPTIEVQGHQMVGLDDLTSLFQLQVREDVATRAVTATYRDQTLVLTPDQSLVSASGRLVSLPAPLTRQGSRWLVPIEFISRALAPIYGTRLELRPASRLLIVGDLRVPRVAVQYADGPASLRATFEIAPRAGAVVTLEPGRLLVRIDADALDASLSPPPSQQSLLTGIRVIDSGTIQLDLGPRFSSHRVSPPASSGAATLLTIELVAAGPDSSAAAPIAPDAPAAPGAPIAPGAPDAPIAPGTPLPVFGGAGRPTIRTIVIDPGHGGEDNGVAGPRGTRERDVTLSVARRVKSTLESRLGVRVLLTHEGGSTVGSDGRAAIANNNKADLFISLHANGSPRSTTRGATIFTLSLDRFGEDARRQSQADRAVLPVFGGGSREFSFVEWELAQAAHLEESDAFAGMIARMLRTTAGLPAVGLQRAPMRHLAGANMPAVLIELGYLSNAEEERLLTSDVFQGKVAASLTEAVVAFREYLEQGPTVAAAPTP